MRKRRLFITLLFLLCLTIPTPKAYAETSKEMYVGGMPAGFMLNLDGVQVVAVSEVETTYGMIAPAKDSGILPGDIFTELNNSKVSTIHELDGILSESEGMSIPYKIKRDGSILDGIIHPVQDKNDKKYKLGILIRDCVSGVGTITCIEKDTAKFGSLGHAVYGENKEHLSVRDGKVYACSIVGVNKGVRGKAGELKGIFLNREPLGSATENKHTGIFGTYYDRINLPLVETASLSSVKIGKAEIYTTIDGEVPQKYSINIVKVDKNNKEDKNFVIKITDKKLIDITGGIVQGMSGSPIIQNGKLIGAITHVFVNDPTRGFGIGINEMFGS